MAAMQYWEDWCDFRDMQAMLARPDVVIEWNLRGRLEGKVPFARSADGQPILTPTEMRAVAEIVVGRYFRGQLDPAWVCAVAQVESACRPLAYRFEPARGEASTGLMQVLQSTGEWLAKEMGFRQYALDDWAVTGLYRPFAAVYYGCAYLSWLSTYARMPRSEEFVIRGYNGGPGGVNSVATLNYWNKYKRAKEALLLGPSTATATPAPYPPAPGGVVPASPPRGGAGGWTYWEERVSPADMAELWANPRVSQEWERAGEQAGRVRFSRDEQLRPFLTRSELTAVAGIIVAKYFPNKNVDPAMLCALVDAGSKRLINGQGSQMGLLQTELTTAQWLNREMGYRAYPIHTKEDLWSPFTSMYYGAAYVAWLSTYMKKVQSEEFIVRAYVGGPQGITKQSTLPFWQKYQDAKRGYGSSRDTGWGSKKKQFWCCPAW
eukprot:jgi/Mesen1/10935/ME000095S10266